ncbi:MAG: YceI family protein [Bryobacteraceae bacterium]|jgi:polyisoprenoid-binding protein YceI
MAQVIYQIDSAHSGAQFSVRHLMVSNVRGEFTELSGSLAYDASNPANSSLEARVEVASINTRDEQRDAHLKSPDFFDAEKFPELTFRSKQVTRHGDGWLMKGDLTIHGVTREVTLAVEGPTPEVKDPWGGYRIGATAETKIHRKDFGLTWNMALEAGGVVVGDEVKISIELEAMRQA